MHYYLLLLTGLFIGTVSSLAQGCPLGEVEVSVEITADTWTALETSWVLSDRDDVLMASGSDTGTSICLPANTCLMFSISDDFGDGIVQGGGYKVYLDNVLVTEGDNFGYFTSIEFGDCPDASSCYFAMPTELDEVYTSNLADAWFSFIPSETGRYRLSTCNETSLCNTTLWVYDYCQGLDWDDTQEGAIYYTSTGCTDGKAALEGQFTPGQEYFIRIGDNDDSCADQSIQLAITYLGAVVGCTDITACSYDPLATENDPSTCFYAGDPACPSNSGPDLVVLEGALFDDMSLGTIENSDACYIEEGCLLGYGTRHILEFTTHIKNIGDLDYYIGETPANTSLSDEQWEWDVCHGHWHYEGYAEYLLFDATGREMPAGFKNGFCVMDLECSDGGTATYGCGVQGISAGCGDIYGKGLSCQWIDITDVPDGSYTLVVRVNWDNSPDGLGNYELNHTNNWAQVCIDITRDIDGVPSLNKYLCAPYTDCLGVAFGDTQPDCTGVCGGNTLAGDMNFDNAYTADDVIIYASGILNESMPVNSCNDLNSDGLLTAHDAALAISCIVQELGEHNHSDNTHNHCSFPVANVQNLSPAYFSIAANNISEKYIDIAVETPNNYILAYEMEVYGITMTNVENLVPNDFAGDLMHNPSTGKILALSVGESPLSRYIDSTPFLRIYYSEITEPYVCIGVSSVVNHNYEQIIGNFSEPCLEADVFSNVLQQIAPSSSLAVQCSPHPIRTESQFSFVNPHGLPHHLYITDIYGSVVRSYPNISRGVNIKKGTLSPGIYLYTLVGSTKTMGKLLIQ